MLTMIFLIVVIGNSLTIHEMPNMQMCETLGKEIVAMRAAAKWNCVEGGT